MKTIKNLFRKIITFFKTLFIKKENGKRNEYSLNIYIDPKYLGIRRYTKAPAIN